MPNHGGATMPSCVSLRPIRGFPSTITRSSHESASMQPPAGLCPPTEATVASGVMYSVSHISCTAVQYRASSSSVLPWSDVRSRPAEKTLGSAEPSSTPRTDGSASSDRSAATSSSHTSSVSELTGALLSCTDATSPSWQTTILLSDAGVSAASVERRRRGRRRRLAEAASERVDRAHRHDLRTPERPLTRELAHASRELRRGER